MQEQNFYRYQQQRTRILLFWGLTNTIGGTIAVLRSHKAWQQFWLQCLAWGAIDAVIAIVGLRGVAQKLAKPPSSDQLNKDKRFFHRLLLINAYLDISYILSGFGIGRWSRLSKEARNGMGFGFVVQGLFLFGFDALVAREVKRRWLK